ncbi:MAG: hypothetical protein IKW85_13625 [Muribaculaceae bacterium]|nr:hypothetical protein [Muribaculaceae bacterium]
MRHIFSIIFLLCFGMIADAEVAEFDSASYALGDVIIRSIKESPDSIFPGNELSEAELAEVIRGFKENLPFMKYSQDSIKNISFALGMMQGVFLIDGTHYQEEPIPYDCIYDGLMKVANHELTLPQDTISIMEYMNSLAKVSDTIPEEENCKFYTGYGVMKGLQPGLQEYIYEMTGKSQNGVPANYESYAAGFAMMMKQMSLTSMDDESELSSYGMGVEISLEIVTRPLPFHFVEADFFDGCHAGAGFNERKITVEESDRIFSTLFPPDSEGPLKEYQKNYPD